MESALIVPVPAAERVVGPLRDRLDPAAAQGVPAHITVMYPFVAPGRIDASVVDRLRRLFAPLPEFEFLLGAVRWFEPAVLWLAPEPASAFRSLTAMVNDEWPEVRPYDDAFDEVIPHLTIGETDDRNALLDAERELRGALPIACRAGEVHLLVGSVESRWETLHRFALDGGAGA